MIKIASVKIEKHKNATDKIIQPNILGRYKITDVLHQDKGYEIEDNKADNITIRAEPTSQGGNWSQMINLLYVYDEARQNSNYSQQQQKLSSRSR